MSEPGTREQWSGRLGFILAAAGSAVGLGNIWRFPFITGRYGGGAFLLIYLTCVAVVGLPVMICEISLGRHTQRNPVGAFRKLAPRSSTLAHAFGGILILIGFFLLCFRNWGWGTVLLLCGLLVFRFGWTMAGGMGVLAGFVILSFYSVVAGWTIGYLVQAAAGGLSFDSVPQAADHFETFVASPYWMVGCHFVFIFLCVLIVCRGVRAGIERWSKILMPVLFLLLIALIVRGLSLPGSFEGVRFFLNPDFSRISAEGVLVALGQAFFSLSLGMGAIITYGSYVSRDENVFMATLSVVLLDTLVAVLAGLAMFPAVFALGFEPDAGPGLVFQVLPTVFHHMPLGPLWAVLFFILLLVAALTSGISLLEVITAYFIDERKWSRLAATTMLGFVLFLLGSLCALSITDWTNLQAVQNVLIRIFGSARSSLFDVLDYVSSSWFLPLGGMLIALFVGWVWGIRNAVDEIRHGSQNFADVHLFTLLSGLRDDPSHNARIHVVTLASVWGLFVRFICPFAVLIAFLHTIGWIRLTGQ